MRSSAGIMTREEGKIIIDDANLKLRLRTYTTDAIHELEKKNSPPYVFLRANRFVRVIQDERGCPEIKDLNEHGIRAVRTVHGVPESVPEKKAG